MPNHPDKVTMRAGVVAINNEPVLRFASVPQAGVFLSGLGYRAQESAGLWTFYRPTRERPDVLGMMLAASESLA